MTDDLLRGDEQSQSENGTLASETTSRSGGEAAVVGQAGETVVVTRPAPGQTVEIQAVPGQTYVLSFPPGQAQVQVEGDNFILGFDDNGDGTIDSQVVFLDLVNVADTGEAPTFQIAGVDIGSEVLLGQALALAGQQDAPLDEVAAGPGGLGGGGSTYDDNLGSILDLLVAQGVIPPVFLEFGLIELEDDPLGVDEVAAPDAPLVVLIHDETRGVQNANDDGVDDEDDVDPPLPPELQAIYDEFCGCFYPQYDQAYVRALFTPESLQAMGQLPFGPGESVSLNSVVDGSATGLFTGGTDSAEAVNLYNFGDNVIVGATDEEEVVFIVYLDAATGEIWFVQCGPINHDDTSDHDEADTPELLNLLYTVTGAGGSTSGPLQIQIQDDGPSVELEIYGGGELVHDETPGDDGADDAPFASLPGEIQALFAAVTTQGNDGDVDGANKDVGALGFARAFGSLVQIDSVDFGTDGPANNDKEFVLSLGEPNGQGLVDSGVKTTEGQDIYLFLEGGVIVGRVDVDGDGTVDETDPAAFAIAIDPHNGEVFLAQWLSLEHPESPLEHDEAVSLLEGSVHATVTVTDGDGDQASDSVEIGSLIKFEDDGPSVDVGGASDYGSLRELQLNLDETIDPDGNDAPGDGADTYALGEGVDANGDDDDILGQLAVDGVNPIGKLTTPAGALAGLFAVTKDAGSDGEQSLTHAFKLVLSGAAASNLLVTPEAVGGNPDMPDDLTIYFYSAGDHVVEGRVGGEFGPVALRITLSDPDAGVLGDETLTVEQFLAIDHGDDGNLFDSEIGLYLPVGSLTVELTSTLTDGDDDTASDSHSVTLVDGNATFVSIDDDGPMVDVDAAATTEELAALDLVLDESLGNDPAGPNGLAGATDDVAGAVTLSTNPDSDQAIGKQETDEGGLAVLFTEGVAADFGTDGAGSRTDVLKFVLGGASAATTLVVTALEGTDLAAMNAGERVVSLQVSGDGTVVEGVIPGTAAVGDEFVAFRITLVNPEDPETAYLVVEQFLPLDHGSDAPSSLLDEALDLLIAQGGTLGLTLTTTLVDGDGDEVSSEATVTLVDGNQSFVTFEDDGPEVTVSASTSATVVHDETPGDDADAHDTPFASLPGEIQALFAAVTTPGNDGDVDGADKDAGALGFAQSLGSLVNVNADYGTDGAAAADATQYALTLGAANGLGMVASGVQTTEGQDIYLFLENGVIVGRVDVDGNGVAEASDPAAFAIAIDADSGEVFLSQWLSLEHPNDLEHDEPIALNGDAVQVAVTVTDGDGDQATDTVGVGAQIAFQDDGPSVDVGGASDYGSLRELQLNLDETIDPDGNDAPGDGADTYALGEGVDANGDDDDILGQLAVDGVNPIGKLTTPVGALAGLFAVTKDAGSDGEQSLTHAFKLMLSGAGLATSLSVTEAAAGGNPVADYGDHKIYLYSAGDHVVEGRVGGEFGPVALRITLSDPDAGVLDDETLTVEQFLAIDHGDDGNLFDSEIGLYLPVGSLTVELTSTLTDGDDDTASDSHSVTLVDGNATFVSIDDDGPMVDVDAAATTEELAALDLVLDESLGNDPAGPNGLAGATDDVAGAVTLSTNPDSDQAIGKQETDEGGLAVLFTEGVAADFGTDGAGSRSDVLKFVLGGATAATTLVVTALEGTALETMDAGERVVSLQVSGDGTVVEGVIPGTAAVGDEFVAFRITLVNPEDPETAYLVVEQFLPLDHGSDAPSSLLDEALDLLIAQGGTLGLTLTTTLVDGDGDEVSSEATVTLVDGNQSFVTFEDDGPEVTVSASTSATVVHDETPGDDADAHDTPFASLPGEIQALFAAVTTPGNDGDVDGADKDAGALGFAQSLGSLVNVNADYGTDGAAAADATQYALTLGTPNDDGMVASGVQTTEGQDIYLFLENGVIVGRVDVDGNGVAEASDPAAFAIAIDADSGEVFLSQWLSLEHPDDLEHDEPIALNGDAVQVAVTVTDGDGDQATDTVGVGAQIAFEDDGPDAVDDGPVAVAEDTALIINIQSNDEGGADGVDFTDGTKVFLATAPTKGVAVYNDDGTFTYTPNAGAEGADSFTYTIIDADGDTDTATVTVTIAADSTPSLIKADDSAVDEDDLAPAGSDQTDPLTDSGEIEVSFGNDQPANLLDAFAFTGGAPANGPNGEAITYTPSGDGDSLTASIDGVDIFTVTITGVTDNGGGNVTYGYQVTLLAEMDHLTGPNGQNDFDFTAQFTVTDSDGDPVAGDFEVTVVDDVPDAVDDGPVAVAEDTATIINIQSNDEGGADGVDFTDGTKVFLATAPTKGVAVYNDDGTFTYTPNAGAEGADSFTYTIIDADGDTDTATVTVTIAADSTPSLIKADDSAVDEDDLAPAGSDQTDPLTDSGEIEVSFGNDQPANLLDAFAFTGGAPANGPNGEAITYTPSGDGDSLTASIDGVDIFTVTITGVTDNGGGNVTYGYQVTLLAEMDHLTGPNGQNDFDFTAQFTVTDSDGDPVAGDFEVTVVDDVPDAVDDGPVAVAEDTATIINIQSNDEGGADGVDFTDGTKVFLATAPTKGVAVYNDDGTFTYTPNAGAEGADSFTYTIIDADGDTDTATVTVTIAADSTPSLIKADDSAVDEDDLAPAGSDQTDPLTDSGEIEVSFGNDQPANLLDAFAFTGGAPANGPNGEAITYTPSGDGDSLTASIDGVDIFTVTITGVTDNGGGNVTYGYQVTLLAEMDHLTGPNGQNDFDFTAQFTVTDSDGDPVAGDFEVTVVDDVPDAVDDGPVAVAEDTALIINIQSNDEGGADGVDFTDGTKVFLATAPTKGVAVYNDDGTFTYTPNAGAEGADSFTYTIIDADGDTDTATVTVTIAADSTPSLIKADDSAVDEDDLAPAGSDQTDPLTDSGEIEVSFGNDQPANLLDAFAFTGGAPANGPNGEAITYTPSGDGDSLTASIDGVDIFTVTITGVTDNGGGNVTYGYQVTLLAEMDHLTGPNGQNDFDFTAQFTVTDSDGDPVAGDFEVTVVDDVPDAVDDGPVAVAEDTATIINIQSNDEGGADGVDFTDGTKVFLATAPTKGVAVYNDDGTFTYTPNAGAEGADSFTYTIIDADGDTDTATVTVTIAADSTPSLIKADDSAVDEDDLAPAGSDQTDPLTDSGEIEVSFGNDQPANLLDAFVFTGGAPTNGPNGEAITYTPSGDGDSLTASIDGVDIFTVTITGVTDNGGGNVTYGYQVTLLAEMDHLTGPNGQNDFDFTAQFTVTDSDGDPVAGDFEVTVVDDVPDAADDVAEVCENTPVTFDLLFVLDVSGSMDDPSGVPGFSRLQAAGEALKQLIDAYFAITENVEIDLVTFASGANFVGSFDSAQEAKDAVDIIVAATGNGSTNYEAALETAMANYSPDAATATDFNTVYFLSDGVPTAGGGSGNSLSASDIADWEAFLTSHGANAIAVGVGGDLEVGDPDLTAVAHPGIPVIVDNFADLADALLGTVPPQLSVSGNVLNGADENPLTDDAGQDHFGADGPGEITSVVGADVVSSVYDPATKTTTVTTDKGVLKIVMSGPNAGDYTYTPNAPVQHGAPNTPTDDVVTDTFTYVITDGDGDTAEADLVIQIKDKEPVANDDTDKVEAGGVTTGNVLTGVDPDVLGTPDADDDGAQVADLFGADGKDAGGGVVGVALGDTNAALDAPGSLGVALNGAFGTLVLNADGSYSYTQTVNVGAEAVDTFTYTIKDGDGDLATATLEITVTPNLDVLVVGTSLNDHGSQDATHTVPNDLPGFEDDGDILGGVGNDVLIGDPGGSVGIDANIILVLDTSGSMSTNDRLEALQDAVNALLDSLAGSSANNVRVHIIEFGPNSTANVVGNGTYNIVVNGVVQTGVLDDAQDDINGLNDNSATNYEAGLQLALNWINGAGPIAGAEVNQLFFVSDGAPNRALDGNSTNLGDVIEEGSSDAISHILGTGADGDSESEVGLIEAAGFTIEAIGIELGLGSALNLLGQVEGVGGEATDVQDPQDLTEVLSSLSAVLLPAGNDVLGGGDGADLIFGDVLFTDLLADAEGINLPPGSGWAVIQALIADDFFGVVPEEVNQNIIDFLRNPTNQTTYELFRESVGSDGEGRDGGHDTIDGGAGNDTIFGQEGDDSIDGGSGQDVIAGGTGNDTMTGGGGERDTFRWSAADHGTASGGGTISTVYNFAGVTQATNDHFAWELEIETSGNPESDNGWNGPLDHDDLEDINELGNGDYEDVDANDGDHFETLSPNNDGDVAAFVAQFTVAEDFGDITQIDLLINANQEGGSPDAPAHFAVWNYNTGNWEVLETFEQNQNADHSYTGTISGDFDNYLGGAGNDQISIMLLNADDEDWLRIDYVEVEVTSSIAGISDPDTDTITDFEFTNGVLNANNDVLDLSELLQGVVDGNSAAELADYLHFDYAGGNTTIQVDHDGAAGGFQPTLNIVLQGVDLTNSNAFADDEQIIQALINGNQLVV